MRTVAGLVALGAVPQMGRADYGQGATLALPGLVPSPIRPTGPMAETCNVVALGREDVCLEPKLLMTAYDKLQLEKALASTKELLDAGAHVLRHCV